MCVLIKSRNQIARRMRKNKKKGWNEKMRKEVKFKVEKKYRLESVALLNQNLKTKYSFDIVK